MSEKLDIGLNEFKKISEAFSEKRKILTSAWAIMNHLAGLRQSFVKPVVVVSRSSIVISYGELTLRKGKQYFPKSSAMTKIDVPGGKRIVSFAEVENVITMFVGDRMVDITNDSGLSALFQRIFRCAESYHATI